MSHIETYKLEIKVRNDIGVLTRITVVIRKYGFNVEKLHVEPTPDSPDYSLMTITLSGGKDKKLETLLKKIQRLIPVLDLKSEKIQ